MFALLHVVKGYIGLFVWRQAGLVRGNEELLYLRFAAMAAVFLSLGGCSFFDFWGAPEAPKADRQITAVPAQGTQLAALPGYQTDQDVIPRRIGETTGYIGTPLRRPAAVIEAPPVKRRLTFKDLLPAPLSAPLLAPLATRPILDLQPIAASFEPGSHTLADLVADQDWRKRTSETLNRLFQ